MKKRKKFYFTEKPKFSYLARPLIKLQTRVISTIISAFKMKRLIQSLNVGELPLKELQTTGFGILTMFHANCLSFKYQKMNAHRILKMMTFYDDLE